jgi:hypothetical protein
MFDDEEDLEALETPAGVDTRRPRRPSPPPTRTGKAARVYKPYTPQFSTLATVSVRRLAWALEVSMPKAVDKLVNALPSIFPPSFVCPVCKDPTKCAQCAFNQPSAAEQAAPVV